MHNYPKHGLLAQLHSSHHAGINLVLNSSYTINIQIIKLINFDIYCFFIFNLIFCTDLCGRWILNINAPILSINSRPSNGLICPMKTNPSKQVSPLPSVFMFTNTTCFPIMSYHVIKSGTSTPVWISWLSHWVHKFWLSSSFQVRLDQSLIF